MTAEEFNKLSDIHHKANFAWLDGEFIAARRTVRSEYFLYQLQDFYVEIESRNQAIISVKGFKEGAGLDVYLEQINISELLLHT